jgi:hypothetical protein
MPQAIFSLVIVTMAAFVQAGLDCDSYVAGIKSECHHTWCFSPETRSCYLFAQAGLSVCFPNLILQVAQIIGMRNQWFGIFDGEVFVQQWLLCVLQNITSVSGLYPSDARNIL